MMIQSKGKLTDTSGLNAMLAQLRGIKGRLLLIPLVGVLALVAVGAVAVQTVGSVMMDEREARARVIVEAALTIVEDLAQRSARGEMTVEAAQKAARDAVRAIRFDGAEYAFVLDQHATVLAHFNPKLEGQNLWDAQDKTGKFFARELVKLSLAGGGFESLYFPKPGTTEPVAKINYAKPANAWGWIIGAGIFVDTVEAAAAGNRFNMMGTVALLALMSVGLTFWIGRSLSAPILRLTRVTNQIAEGDFSIEVPDRGRTDEVGTLAKAIDVLREHSAEAARLVAEEARLKAGAADERRVAMAKLADAFEASVKCAVEGIASSATGMEASANSMTSAAATSDSQTVAAATAAAQTSVNVGTVATATEELSASIQEIARQVSHSTEIASGAVAEAERANTVMSGLAESAKSVGEVVMLINDIAQQTNLLALNATIEAARAGEAGKGFAVVASEVKSLATQTAKATEDIQTKVAEIQSMTDTAVGAIQAIGGTVSRMNEITSSVAAAVEEQGTATRDIAGNIQQAAGGAQQVSQNVAAAQRAVSETKTVAAGVLNAAGSVTKETSRLRGEVERFLADVRAA
jgi:methyl-accepting chemotaxis protein